MKEENFLLTILMPVFNAELYLKEAIDSILCQTYTMFEFLIINDGSTDNSENIIKSYSDRRIKYVENVENIGLIATLNRGLGLAKAKYIARMDADDISAPNRIEKQIDYLEKHADVGLLGTGYTIFGDRNESIQYPCDHEDIKLACLSYNPFCHPSVMIRKEIIDKHQLKFKNEYLHAEEYKLWTEFVVLTKCCNLNESLLMYRSHSQQVSQMHLDIQIENSKVIQNEYLESAGFEKITTFSFTVEEPVFQMRTLAKFLDYNQKKKFFNEEKLEQMLLSRFKNLILESKKIDKDLYQFYRSNTFSQQISWTSKQKLSIFLKYLANRK